MKSCDSAQDENHSDRHESVNAKNDNDSIIPSAADYHDDMTKSKLATDNSSDRHPLCSLDLNSHPSSCPSYPKKDGGTPHSLKSRGSSIDMMMYSCSTMDPVKRLYVLTPHYDNVDDLNRCHHDESVMMDEENCKCTNHIHTLSPNNNSHDMNSMAGTSLGTSHGRTTIDYDSVIYSGYAGSVSAAPSELSDGYSIEEGQDQSGRIGRNLHVWSRGLQSTRNRPLNAKDGGEGVAHSDDGSTSNRDDFVNQVKIMREQRRKKRLESRKDYRARILTEFRAFLSRNVRDVSNCEAKDDTQQGENGSNATMKTPKMKCARDRSGSNDFTPTQIHGRIPWIVFEKDLEEDVSTIHGGSRCEGIPGSPEQNSHSLNDLEHATEQECSHVEQQQDEKKMVSCMGAKTKNGDRMDLVYILLIVLSVATLVAVVAIVIVQL
jgi:hypothetical protein